MTDGDATTGPDRGQAGSRTRARLIAVFVVTALVALGVWSGLRLRIVSDIRHFIPTEGDRDLSDVSAALATSSLTRTSVLVVEGSQPIASAKHLADALREHPEVEWLRRGLDSELQSAVESLYFPRGVYLHRPDISPEGLRARAANLKKELGGPKGSLLRTVAPTDPLLLLNDQIEQLRAGDSGALQTTDGQFVTADGGAAVLFVRTRSSAFSSEPQAAFQADLAAMMDTVRADIDPQATLSQSGLARYAIVTERNTRADVTRVSVASTVGIIVVFLVVFGQLRAIALTFVPVALGVGGGILGCTLLVDEVHSLTLAFGSALLGVGVDYAVHLMFHLAHPGERSPSQVVAALRPGLILGAATTVVGLSGLALTTFPGMRELALFGGVGVAGSLLVTLLVVPAFCAPLPPRRLRKRLIESSQRLLDRVERNGTRAWLFFALVVMVGAAGIIPLKWSDGLRALYQVDPTIHAEDTRVRELTGTVDMSRLVLASGDDLEQALARNQVVHEAVAQSQRAGELSGYRSVHGWLPARAWQEENLQRLTDPEFEARFNAAFEAEGFVPGAFAPFFEQLDNYPHAPLTIDDIRDTPLWPIVDPFILHLDDRIVIATWLRGDLSADLRQTLDSIEGVQRFDQQEFLDRAYGRYRIEMIQMLAAGLFAVALLIVLRYRDPRTALAAFLPALAGALGAIGAAGWVDGTANLIHGASLLLVCSVGADYGVFMVESHRDPHERAVTLASSLLAGLTTVLSFGLLAMSANPALASVGLSVVVGVSCALLTAPVAATLRKDRSP